MSDNHYHPRKPNADGRRHGWFDYDEPENRKVERPEDYSSVITVWVVLWFIFFFTLFGCLLWRALG